MTELPSKAEEFLRELERGLSPLGAAEREDVVAEIRSHLLDRAQKREADLLAPFGSAETLAASFLEERALAGALAGGGSWALGRVLAAGTGTVAAYGAMAALAVVHVIGAALVVCAAVKPFSPGAVGLFVSPGGGRWVLGMTDFANTTGMREVLGWWAIPTLLVPGVLLLWSANRLLRAAARRRLARVRASARAMERR